MLVFTIDHVYPIPSVADILFTTVSITSRLDTRTPTHAIPAFEEGQMRH